ncbi:MAG: CHAT domain-containing protein [Caldilineaceae bacterium]|nr:CHAT domain-containing protein [Caldilineaceae bacterium]HRJ40905.1 CHAT domain-containing tetratricopeptide repeat protein [Caldilineaceae bacterium]
MRKKIFSLLLALSIALLSAFGSPRPANAGRIVPSIRADSQTDDLIVAWHLPLLIASSGSQAIDQCVRMAFAVNRWNTTLTGTLSYSASQTETYDPSPRDRLRVIYADGSRAEFRFSKIQGYVDMGADEFLSNDYQLDCQATAGSTADLRVVANRTGSIVSVTSSGSLSFAETVYDIDVESSSDIYFESSFGGSEYRSKTTLAGEATSSGFALEFDESLFYHQVTFEGESAALNQRTTNSQWQGQGSRYTLQKGWLTQSYKDGKPSRLQSEWRASGTLQRDNRAWGDISGQLTDNYFHAQATVGGQTINLQSIPLTASAPLIAPAISGREPTLTSRTPDGKTIWEANTLERTAIAVKLLALSFGLEEEFMLPIVSQMGVDDSTMAAVVILTARMQNGSLEYDSAHGLLQEALDDLGNTGQEDVEAGLLTELGRTLVYLGDMRTALTHFERALLLHRQVNDAEQQAVVLANMAYIYDAQAEYEKALTNYLAALEAYRRLNAASTTAPSLSQELFQVRSPFNQRAIYNNIGSLYHTLGEDRKAENAYKNALSISQKAADTAGQATALHNLGKLYTDTGDYAKSQTALEEALAIANSRFDPNGSGHILAALGDLSDAQKEYDDALEYYAQAQRLFAGSENGPGAALVDNQIGLTRLKLADYKNAVKHLQKALTFYEGNGYRTDQATVLSNLGFTQEEQGNLTEALASYRQAVGVIETIQGEIRIDSAKSAFLAGASGVYSHLIDLLWQTGKESEAFTYAERARARAFLTLIGNAPLSLQTGSDKDLAAQETALRNRIYDLQNALVAEKDRPQDAEASRSDQLAEDLKAARTEYEQLLTRLKLTNPEYAAITQIETLSLAEVRAGALDDETTLIEYFVLEDRTLAWVIDRNRTRTVELKIDYTQLVHSVDRLRYFIADKDPAAVTTAGQLYSALIAPLTPHIRHENLVIVPHNVLHYLPFAALWNSRTQRYLLEDYTISHAPSASALPFLQAKSNLDRGQLLALGNPDNSLSYASTEVVAVAALYGTRAYLGSQASESRFRSSASQADILLLAVHGIYEPSTPLFSRVELAKGNGQDGFLEVHEILGLDLKNANLVVLSACNAALGKQTSGDEIVGLTRAFLTAGAPAVVSTLWAINDEASAVLMETFHRHLKIDGLTIAQSLRQAQIDVLADEKWALPYYWAAFMLTGDDQ